jgi:hypothetical protein
MGLKNQADKTKQIKKSKKDSKIIKYIQRK